MTSFTGGTRSLWGAVDGYKFYYNDAVSRELLAPEFVRGLPRLSLKVYRVADG